MTITCEAGCIIPGYDDSCAGYLKREKDEYQLSKPLQARRDTCVTPNTNVTSQCCHPAPPWTTTAKIHRISPTVAKRTTQIQNGGKVLMMPCGWKRADPQCTSPHRRARPIAADEGCNIERGIELTCTGPGEEGTGNNHHFGLGYMILFGIGAVAVVGEPQQNDQPSLYAPAPPFLSLSGVLCAGLF